MGYYVLENTMHNYSRIHLSDCPSCKHGEGPRPGHTGCWHGEYNTFQEALDKTRKIGRPLAPDCSKCGPRVI